MSERTASAARAVAAVLAVGGLVGAAAWAEGRPVVDLGLGAADAAVSTHGPATSTGADGTTRTEASAAGGTAATAAQLVTSSALGCPGGATGTVVAAAAAPAEALAALKGAAGPELQPGGSRVGRDGIPVQEHAEDDEPRLLTGEGTAAPGAVFAQATLAGRDEAAPGTRGLALSACGDAGEEQWLVAGGDGAGRTEEVLLTNLGEEAATAEVTVVGDDGPAGSPSSVVVPAGARSSVLLEAVAPGVASPAVRVRVTDGAVSATLRDRAAEGTTDLGTELVAPAAVPGPDLVLALPGAGAAAAGQDVPTGSTVLRVVNPGEEDAVVEVRALTADGGAAVPGGVTTVPAGSTRELALEHLPEGTAALRLRTSGEVTGAVVRTLAPAEGEDTVSAASDPDAEDQDTKGAQGKDSPDEDAPDEAARTAGPGPSSTVVHPAGELAWSVAVALDDTPLGLALPAAHALGGATATLTLAAVERTSVELTLVDAKGGTQRRELDLAFDSTTSLELPEGTVSLWVRPAGGAGVLGSVDLVGADELGPLLSSPGVPALPWEREVVEVRPYRP